jgi:quercetin dioxygenase-like cupin family protein
MAIHHAAAGETIDIPLLATTPGEALTRTLFKTAELEVMRMVVLKDKEIPSHRVPRTVTMQCLEGRVALVANGRMQELRAGQMLYFPGGEEHSIKGIEDASILLTIVLGA